MNFSNFRKKLTNNFIKYSIMKSNNIKSYVDRITFKNNKTGEIYNLSYDFDKTRKNDYLWCQFVSDYIQNNAVLDGKKAIFITLTLDSDFHPYKGIYKNKKLINTIRNNKYNDSLNGYKLLNDSFRSLYKNFQISRNLFYKIDYIKVIEPHKDFTPHLHAIIYIDSKHLDKFESHFKNILKINGIGSEFDYQVLDDSKCSVSYLLKYVKKTLFSDDIMTSRLIDGWKKINKIRMFSSSNIPLNRYTYKMLSNHIKYSSNIESYSIIDNILKSTNITINYYDNLTIYKTKSHIVKNNNYSIVINKKVNNNLDYDSLYSDIYSINKYFNNYDSLFSLLIINNFNFKLFYEFLHENNYDSSYLYYISDFNSLSSLIFYYENLQYYDYSLLVDSILNFIYSKFKKNKSYSVIDYYIYENGKLLFDSNSIEYNII